MQRAVQTRRWGWFAALLASAPLIALMSFALFAPLYFIQFADSLQEQSSILTAAYTLVAGGLLALAPPLPLLYSLHGRDEPAGS